MSLLKGCNTVKEIFPFSNLVKSIANTAREEDWQAAIKKKKSGSRKCKISDDIVYKVKLLCDMGVDESLICKSYDISPPTVRDYKTNRRREELNHKKLDSEKIKELQREGIKEINEHSEDDLGFITTRSLKIKILNRDWHISTGQIKKIYNTESINIQGGTSLHILTKKCFDRLKEEAYSDFDKWNDKTIDIDLKDTLDEREVYKIRILYYAGVTRNIISAVYRIKRSLRNKLLNYLYRNNLDPKFLSKKERMTLKKEAMLDLENWKKHKSALSLY